jgi:glycosyltransferase involved in cell wall biosynthesis
MKILFALPGLHRIDRGAEIAFISVAKELARVGENVTLIGSGHARPDAPYNFIHSFSLSREHFRSFPEFPLLRNECIYEELTFVPGLLCRYQPHAYDVTLTCSYPFTNWLLRRPTLTGRRPPHVFITQNGDWPATSKKSEYRFFGCDGLVCTNPDYFERNRSRWNCALIPNGIDLDRFKVGPGQRQQLGLPADRLVVLMVSALIPSKRVDVGIKALSQIPNAHLVVAGDGPLRPEIESLAKRYIPGRFTLVSIPAEEMPSLYRSADVFLHLSKEESFGNVFLEAMACGLPIVAHDSARLRWIVGDRHFLVDSTDPVKLLTAIKEAAESPAEAKHEFTAKAAEFSWPKVGNLYHEFLKSIVAEHTRN